MESLQRSGGGEATSGTRDRSPGIDGEVVEARTRIRLVLTGLCRLLVSERGIRPPADEVPAMGRFVAAHRVWLSAHPACGEHAADLRALAGDGRLLSMAYPARRGKAFVGLCPALVLDPEVEGGQRRCDWRLFYVDGQREITCGGCGLSADVRSWRRWMVDQVADDAVVDGYMAARVLSERWCRPVDPSLIRQWMSRGKVVPRQVVESQLRGAEWVDVLVPERDERGRVIYELGVVVAAAVKAWGEVPEAAGLVAA